MNVDISKGFAEEALEDGIDLRKEILALKKDKNAVILAHYYTLPEVQDIADFVGDSLALSQQAADCPADIILFAGVHFMAETAKILSPQKKVLLADTNAGCSLAESCPADAFAEFCRARPDHKVITYVNTTAAVKALTDVCCTSSNALKIVQSFPASQPLIFAPDRNLGAYIKEVTGRDNIVLWDGACHVHQDFDPEGIAALKKEHPKAKVLAHPECPAEVLALADKIGSTAALLDFCTSDPGAEYIIVTEPGILHRMRRDNPVKTFFAAPGRENKCNECEYMKMVDLRKIYLTLKHETPEIEVDPKIRERAGKAIFSMLELS